MLRSALITAITLAVLGSGGSVPVAPSPAVGARAAVHSGSLIGPTMGEIKRTVRLGTQDLAALTITNGGTRAANMTVGVQVQPGQSYTGAWRKLPNLPVPLRNNALAAGNGVVYSVGGTDGADRFTAVNAYRAGASSWTPIADMRVSREGPGTAFVAGKLYVFGGWTGWAGLRPATTSLEIYDPVRNTWSAGADLPRARGWFATAVLDGLIYVVGGCDATCDHHDVFRYDPARDTWKSVTRYPTLVHALSCGGILGYVYCAGGVIVPSGRQYGTVKGYRYDPVHNRWDAIADLPVDGSEMSYAATIDALLVSAGVFRGGGQIEGTGFAYRPATNTWVPLTEADPAGYGGGGACGFYRAGGVGHDEPTAAAQVLAGTGSCGLDAAVPWLSATPTTLRLAKGAKTRVTVTLDATKIDRAGVYRAWLEFATDTPAGTVEVPVTMTVTP